MSSKFRTEIRRYYIYCILDEIFETVFVGKSYGKHPISHYYSHMRGEHSLTKDAYIDADITEPEFIILEIVHCTGRVAFKHVLAWYNYFEEQGYAILTDEKAGHMVDDMSHETQEIYDTVCAPYTLYEVLTRKVKEPLTGQPKPQKNEQKRGMEALVQFNMRVKERVAQAYRAFCIERGITQSESLRLLLLGEDFADRDLVMQSYQQELNALKTENAKLKEQNKELLALQKEKESWALRHRNEWIRIAKAIVSLIVERVIKPRIVFEFRKKPFSFKSKEGHALFSGYNYPQEGGCFEVNVSGLVYGTGRNNIGPEKNVPLFICGQLKDKTPIKFRWYPREDFLGIPPCAENISFEGDWLLGGVIAKDGAANLVFAIPLRGIEEKKPQVLDIEAEILAIENEGERSSVDELIAAADRKRNKN